VALLKKSVENKAFSSIEKCGNDKLFPEDRRKGIKGGRLFLPPSEDLRVDSI